MANIVDEGIAIVGMACRLPGGVSCPDSFWDFLLSQRCARGPVPASRFNAEAFYNPQKDRTGCMRYTESYCIDNDLEAFDNGFFEVTVADVQTLDPQQRQLLECCYEALESGGVTLDQVANTMTGVYVGNFASDYESLAFKEPEKIEGMQVLGMGRTTVSNRVSYLYNLNGPSVTMDTACSSTMYALHFAVQALRNGEIPAAFVGGVNLILTLEYHFAIGQIGALSPTAMCHAFDASADGYARGESINVLYLKRVSDALKDGDPIRGVIRGISLTANGKNNGITLPSAAAQELSIRKAYEHSGPINYGSVGFVECHGTGTPTGDPIETTAIANVFEDSRDWHDPILIGSTKPQVGHGEAGSALTSIIKVVLAMEKGIIPGTIGIKRLNPSLDLRRGSVAVVTKTTPWPAGKARRASVNSTGYGGANGHVVLETIEEYLKSLNMARDTRAQYLLDPYTSILQTKFLVPISAHDDYSLSKSLENIQGVVHGGKFDIHELLYTLAEGRTRFSHRGVIPITISHYEFTAGQPSTAKINLSTPTIAFVFTGQGAQWAGMGKELLNRFPTVKRVFWKLNKALAQLTRAPDWTIEGVLLEPAETSQIGDVAFSQPICTAIQIALVDLLREWGVNPVATIGHSSGELAAAYAARLISAEDAIIAAYLRGVHATLTQEPGTMMAVAMGAADAESLLAQQGITPEEACVACINSPESVTLSGKPQPISMLYDVLKSRSVLCKKLLTGGKAYHSPSMRSVGSGYNDAIMEATEKSKGVNGYKQRPNGYNHGSDFTVNGASNGVHQSVAVSRSAVQELKADSEPRPAMISSVTMEALEPSDISGSYWQKNLESPVLFGPALTHLLGLKFGREDRLVDCLIEIGPHSALKGPIKQIIASPEVVQVWKSSLGTAPKIPYLPTLERSHDAEDDVMRLATDLFLQGSTISMRQVNGQGGYRPEKPLVGLPMYPWNHTVPQPLIVTRATKDYKFATHPRHDLIGSRLPGGNRMEPIWRNNLRLKDVPWIKDHVIGNTTIVPGAAYIAMAIEAAAQFAEDITLDGPAFEFEDAQFHLHVVSIKAALIIGSSGTADIMINLRHTDASATSNRFDFKICSVTNDRWTEHADGSISYKLMNGKRPVKSSFAGETSDPIFEETIGKDAWYDRLKYRGFDFGPFFRVIDEIEILRHESRARAKTPILKTMAKDTVHESRYAVHPLTIDAVLQGRVVAVYNSRADKEEATQIPVFVEDMTINPASWAKNKTGLIDSVAWTEGARSGGSHSRLVTEDGYEIISTKHVKWRQFENQGSQEKVTKTAAREPYYRLHWKPDIDFLDSEKATSLYHSDFKSPSGVEYLDEIYNIRIRLETVTVLYICQALELVSKADLSSDPSLRWTHAYYNWMQHVRDEAAAGNMVLCDKDATQLTPELRSCRIETLLSELPPHFPQLEYNGVVINNMAGILNGTTSGVNLAVDADVLAGVYADGSIHDAARKNLRSLIDILAHKSPTMKILEVGAGTGSCTSVALEVLNVYDKSNGHSKRYADYTFTDISPSFFEKAEEMFSEYPALTFKTFDVEIDPEKQGFECGKYDLILASNVLHAPGNTDLLLANCSKLLKPGGKLVMLEITQTKGLTPVQFAFGTLPSFWGCLDDIDSDRPLGPFRTLPSWDEQLRRSGFSGLDLILRDFPEPLALESVMMSTATHTLNNSTVGSNIGTTVIVHSTSQTNLARAIAQNVGGSEDVRYTSLANLSELADSGQPQGYIVLEELDGPVLMDMQSMQLEGFKKLVRTAHSILWVTAGDLMVGKNPALAMVHGINTALMNEHSARNLKFATLDLDNPALSEAPATVQHIAEIFSIVAKAQSREDCETDFILKDGITYISRVVPDAQLNEEFRLDTGDGRLDQDFPTSGNVQLALETPGLLDTVYFRKQPSREIELSPDELEIEVKAVGLNMKDYVIAMGNFESVKSSNESTGTVSRVGSNVTSIKPGDKVICLERGYYDTFLRSPVSKCLKLNENDDLIEMATVGIAHGTALYSLKYLAQLEAGETVLIQAATGGLGLAAIQYAKSVGAEIYATVGTQVKKDYLINEWGIPENHIFWSRALDFKQQLLEETKGRGVDVVLATISGPGFHETFGCLAPCGRLIDVGRGNVLGKGKLGLHVFDESISVFSFDLNFVLEKKPQLASRLLSDIIGLLRAGKIQPIRLDSTFHITEMEKALRYFGQGQHIGKVVLTYGKTNNKIKLKGVRKLQGILARNSYVLAGCHGGLGHSMADSLIEHGARNLVFLSRSGEEKQEIASFVARAEAKGVNVVSVRGDVSNMADVEKAVEKAVEMGPLKGVVYAAMVLQDGFFDTMSLENFNAAVRPKVHGALNLHNATLGVQAELDFFFMTSSTVTYVGHISQSNYAAANAVLDNLARQRREMGLPGTTISLGPIKGVGTLNRKPEYAENLLRSGLIEAPESEFIYHFERLIKGQERSPHFDINTQAHILTGVEYSKHDLSMVQVTRIEKDRRSALLVTTLESRKGAVGGTTSSAEMNGEDALMIPEDRNTAVIVLAEAVAQRLAKLLFISFDDIDITRPLSHYGIDSMSGSELVHWLSQKFSVGISFLELLDPMCTSKHLAGVIYDTAQKRKESVNGTNTTDADVVANAESTKPENGTNEPQTLPVVADHHSRPESKLEAFSKYLKKAVSGPMPVTHSYVCSVINREGNQVYSHAEGLISQGSIERAGFDSVYWMASMTKLVTAVAVTLCVERGQISLDEDVAPVLPDLCSLPVLDGVDAKGKYSTKTRTQPITLRLLLTHQSGCGYHSSPHLARWAKQNGRMETVFDNDFKVMKTFPLMFEPGSGFMYGSGFDWAGELVARLNGVSFEEFLQDNICTPLGMTSTTFHLEKRVDMLTRRVAFYERMDDGYLVPGTEYTKVPATHECGGHGLWSTPRDWNKFVHMILRDGQPILQKSSIDEIFRPQAIAGNELRELLSGPIRASLRSTIDMDAENIEMAIGGPVYVEGSPGRRSAGTLQWSGKPNMFWWIDRQLGIAATTFTQVISASDPRFEELTTEFERAVYADLASA
ncbi:Type I Iterative PKS [Arthroderma sp. PD_2]|nr:Type I Iterative PKS [Arthroderma sp. PD_2]